MDQIPLALEHWFFWVTGPGKGFTPSIGKHDKHALYHIEGIPNNNTLPNGDAMRKSRTPNPHCGIEVRDPSLDHWNMVLLLGSAWLPEADGGLELSHGLRKFAEAVLCAPQNTPKYLAVSQHLARKESPADRYSQRHGTYFFKGTFCSRGSLYSYLKIDRPYHNGPTFPHWLGEWWPSSMILITGEGLCISSKRTAANSFCESTWQWNMIPSWEIYIDSLLSQLLVIKTH